MTFPFQWVTSRQWHFKSQSFDQQLVQAYNKISIISKFHITGPLWGKPTVICGLHKGQCYKSWNYDARCRQSDLLVYIWASKWSTNWRTFITCSSKILVNMYSKDASVTGSDLIWCICSSLLQNRVILDRAVRVQCANCPHNLYLTHPASLSIIAIVMAIPITSNNQSEH